MALLLVFTACEDKDPEDITGRVEFDFRISNPCFYGYNGTANEEMVIRDEAAYERFAEEIRIDLQNADCDTASLPPIDFSQHSLIGVYTRGGGCKADYERTVSLNHDDRQVTYQVSVTYSGLCYMLISHFNWALIPALPSNYSVHFEVSEKNE